MSEDDDAALRQRETCADAAGGTLHAEALALLRGKDGEDRVRAVLAFPPHVRRDLLFNFSGYALKGQAAPPDGWRVWLIRAGRGYGKTRAGAEWVVQITREMPEARIALVGATVEDVRRVMIDGETGILAVARPDDGVLWKRNAGELSFRSGAVAHVYSAAAPEKLRGPAHHAAWCDELAKWRYGDAAWDNLMLGLRLGDNPRALVTTTPRAVPLMRRVMAIEGIEQTNGGTCDNPYLARSVRDTLEAEYRGSRLGRQELDGEMIDDVVGALWTRAMIHACRVAASAVPVLARVVVAVDPPAGLEGDACGIVAVALGTDGRAYVIEDASVAGATPEGWARAVADCAARCGADRVVAEKNQGGEMVRSVLKAADGVLPLKLVHASIGKVARAEPVATLYEGGKVSHVGEFKALEDELCGLVVGGGYQGPGRSPDRADALVWGLTELMLGRRKLAASVRVV